MGVGFSLRISGLLRDGGASVLGRSRERLSIFSVTYRVRKCMPTSVGEGVRARCLGRERELPVAVCRSVCGAQRGGWSVQISSSMGDGSVGFVYT